MPQLLSATQNPGARVLLSHGAGASVQSEFCQLLAQQLASQDIEVWGFNFAYMEKTLAGTRQLPAKMPVLMAEFIAKIAAMPTDLPLVIAGKSMGGRVATLLAASEQLPEQVKGVLAFGYPFHPPKKDNWRTEHFAALQRPVLIVQGTRDPFGTQSELAEKSWPLIEIKWLESANHDFVPLKKSGFNQLQLIHKAALLSRSFINDRSFKNE